MARIRAWIWEEWLEAALLGQEGGQFTLELLGLNPNPIICHIICGRSRVIPTPNPHCDSVHVSIFVTSLVGAQKITSVIVIEIVS